MASDTPQLSFARAAESIGLVTSGAAKALEPLPLDPDFTCNASRALGLSTAQLWAVMRELKQLPCPECGAWSPTRSSRVGAEVICCECALPMQLPADFDPALNHVGLRLGEMELLDLIGSGALGRVYRAWHRRLKRTAAVKVITKALSRSEDDMARFMREVKAMARIEHINIVRILDYGQQDGLHFLAMELLEGETLARRVRKGPLNASDVVDMALQAAAGLDAIHRHKLIHRDIKPSNVMFAADGVKLIDFGMAKGLDASSSIGGNLTTPGMAVGTPTYMSPEQCTSADIDHRADLYSLGMTIYTALTARPPFNERKPLQLMMCQVQDQPTPLSEVAPETPARLAAIVERLIAKNPASRFPSAAALIDNLEVVRDELDGDAPPETAAEMAGAATRPVTVRTEVPPGCEPPGASQRRTLRIALAAIAIALAAGAAFWLARG